MKEKEYYFKTAIEIYEISMYEKVDKGWDKKSYTKHFMTYQDAVRYVTKYYLVVMLPSVSNGWE